MSQTLDFESDPLLKLLTDALRAGPGSPEWAEAVAKLRAEQASGNAASRDEYALLVAAREDLASGRRYREIRPGPNFTRRVFGAIESEGQGTHRALPLASVIAVLSLLTVVAILAVGGYFFFTSSTPQPDSAPAQDLTRVYFVNTVASTMLDDGPGAGWRSFGPLPLDASPKRGVRPGASPDPANFAGGGILWDKPVDPAEPVAMEAVVRVPKAGQDVIVQAFVTDEPNFDNASATSSHELVWLLRDGQASVVLPDGRVAGEAAKLRDNQQRLEVRLMLDRTRALIDAADQRVFDGPHGLDPSKPRYLGVRLLAKGAAPEEEEAPAVIESIRIQKSQPVD